MSKKSKRTRKRSYSSPSREDDEKRHKKRKENEDRHKSKDKYEDKDKHESRTKSAVRHSSVRDEDSSKGCAIKKAVYRHSKTDRISEETSGKHEAHSKDRTESQSSHAKSCSKEKSAHVRMSTINRDSKSIDQRPSTSSSHKKAEKQRSAHPARAADEKTHNVSPNTKHLSSRSHSVVEDLKRHARTPSFSSDLGNKEKQKASCSSLTQDKALTLKSPQKIPSKKSSEDPMSAKVAVMRSLGMIGPRKMKISLSKETKKVLCTKEKSPAEKIPSQLSKTSVNSTCVSKNFTNSNWTSVGSSPKIVEDFTQQTHRENISFAPKEEDALKSLEEKVPPTTTSESISNGKSTNKASATPAEHWLVHAVPAASKMDNKQSDVGFPSKTESMSQGLIDKPSTSCDLSHQMWSSQVQVAEELHLARSDKRLEVNVWESYGELTCMEIDSPEEGVTVTQNKGPQQDLILVLDTNILLSHLDYVKQVISHGLEGLGRPVILIPWVVLQELDSLKKGRGLAGSVSHLACPAISYIYNSLKNREPHLWGQSMQQAAEINDGLNAENNDDRVLQCCLQYQTLYPGCAVTLCTNDKNLCSKALLSGVKAFSKSDLEAERVSRHQHTHTPVLHVPPSPSVTTVPLQSKRPAPDMKGPEEVEMKTSIKCISELELCLKDVLADVLEKEMKAVYDELWLEIVCRKPPWTLDDVLQCFKKHWIAVFGSLVPRRLLNNVESLIKFFNSDNSLPSCNVTTSIYEAKELVKAFKSSSSLVSNALSEMDSLVSALKHRADQPPTEDESADCDVIMNDVEDGREPALPQVSCQQVWEMFHNIWMNVSQLSMEVFKALCFDPGSMQSCLSAGGPPPPQEALACLNKLSSTISQLLGAFSSVLSSGAGEVEVQNLLLVIQSNGISEEISRLSEHVLMDCFSKQEYREKLMIGGTQLQKLKDTLEACRLSTTASAHGAFYTFNH